MRISCPGVRTTIGPLSSEDMNGRGVSSFFAISTEQLLGLRESAVSFGNLKQNTNLKQLHHLLMFTHYRIMNLCRIGRMSTSTRINDS